MRALARHTNAPLLDQYEWQGYRECSLSVCEIKIVSKVDHACSLLINKHRVKYQSCRNHGI